MQRDPLQLDQFKGRLWGVHYAWLGLGGLWLTALVAAVISVSKKPIVPFGYGSPQGHMMQSFFMLAFIAYIVGGLILGRIHNRYTANFAYACYESEQIGDLTEFRIMPAPRHLPFWLFGLFGTFFLFSLPYMLIGSSAGAFFTLLLAVVFIAIGLQPKLWRPIPAHSFALSASMLKIGGSMVPVEAIKGFLVSSSLRAKSDNADHKQQTCIYQSAKTVYMSDRPIATQHMAPSAAGKGIAESVNRYFYEMRARSFQVEAVKSGKNLVLAQGLDLGTAQTLMADIRQITADMESSKIPIYPG